MDFGWTLLGARGSKRRILDNVCRSKNEGEMDKDFLIERLDVR